MIKYISIVVALVISGCQTTPAPNTSPKCDEVLQKLVAGCDLSSQGTVVAADGIGLVFQVLCGIDTGSPKLRLIGITNSPAQISEAMKAGARDAGECMHGTNPQRVVVIEKAVADMRAGN